MNEKRVEQMLNLALVNLCEIAVKGPAVVTMGKAIEAVSVALREVQNQKKEERQNAAAGDEVQ